MFYINMFAKVHNLLWQNYIHDTVNKWNIVNIASEKETIFDETAIQ